MPKPLMSIRDIASLAKVSVSTVSRVINKRQYVRTEIRDRVMAIVREHGFVPNTAARSMVLMRTSTIGIIIPNSFNVFQRQLLSSIERCLETFGYRTTFFFVDWTEPSEAECLSRLRADNLEGIIMIHEIASPSFYEYLETARIPTVTCTFCKEDSSFTAIHVDEITASMAATNHLISLGHRDIAMLTGAHFSFSGQRLQGYQRALAIAGIEARKELVGKAHAYTTMSGTKGMHSILTKKRPFTAVFAETDELAIGAIRALYETGLRVPADVSVIGFDDIDICASLSPALSTIRQPIQNMGRKTAEIIAAMIEGRRNTARDIILDHELVARESTAPPNLSKK